MDGDQNQSATRMVEENIAKRSLTDDTDAYANTDASADNVGGCGDGGLILDPNLDPLIYTLSGADAGLFRVRNNGQIEVGAGTDVGLRDPERLQRHPHSRGLLRRHRLHRR